MTISPFTTSAVMAGAITQVLTNDATISIIVAGMAGGAVRWIHKKEAFRLGIGSVVTGGVCAKYIGPLALSIFERVTGVAVSDDTGQVSAFLMGLCGVAIVGFIFDVFERRASKLEAE